MLPALEPEVILTRKLRIISSKVNLIPDNLDTFKLLNITPESKQRKINLNAREVQDRIQNNRNPKEYIHIYNNYGERELYKNIKYELENLGNFEKIPILLKERREGKLLTTQI